jgi:hypothetical protein
MQAHRERETCRALTGEDPSQVPMGPPAPLTPSTLVRIARQVGDVLGLNLRQELAHGLTSMRSTGFRSRPPS